MGFVEKTKRVRKKINVLLDQFSTESSQQTAYLIVLMEKKKEKQNHITRWKYKCTTYVCPYACLYLYIYIFLNCNFVYANVRTYFIIYIYIYIYIYMYTHTHTHIYIYIYMLMRVWISPWVSLYHTLIYLLCTYWHTFIYNKM